MLVTIAIALERVLVGHRYRPRLPHTKCIIVESHPCPFIVVIVIGLVVVLVLHRTLREADIFNPLSQVILIRRCTHRRGTRNTSFRLHSSYRRRSSTSYRISHCFIHRRVNGVAFVVPSDVVVYRTPYDCFVVGRCRCHQARRPLLVIELVVVVLGPSRFSVPLSFGSGSSQTSHPRTLTV